MGRPRKRPLTETQAREVAPQDSDATVQPLVQPLTPTTPTTTTTTTPPTPLPMQPLQQTMEQQLQLPLFFPPLDTSTLGMDLDMSFLDVGGPSISFLDLLGGDPQSASALPGIFNEVAPKEQPHDAGGGIWPVLGDMTEINFDPSLPVPAPPLAEEFSFDQLTPFMTMPDVPEESPSLSPSSSHATTADATGTSNPGSCTCLTDLYLAMNSLQNLPSELAPALLAARSAARAAHDAILCPVCGFPPLDVGHTPALSTFQSLMMLGALLPGISGAYMRILEMVDAEVARATAENRKLVFTLAGYGGIWGKLKEEDGRCGASAYLEGARLEPAMWRLTVRALLKIDVYGVNHKTAGMMRTCEFEQPGLKDIIELLEERSRSRHEQLDALVASGAALRPCAAPYVSLANETDKPTCLRIIDIAKRSMDDLIIP